MLFLNRDACVESATNQLKKRKSKIPKIALSVRSFTFGCKMPTHKVIIKWYFSGTTHTHNTHAVCELRKIDDDRYHLMPNVKEISLSLSFACELYLDVCNVHTAEYTL